MKGFKLAAMIGLMALATGAAAQVTQSGSQTAGTNGLSNATGSATATVGAQGGMVSIDGHDTYNTSNQNRYAVATAVGPALTSSNDTCMGSTSAGVQGMSVGVSIGSTWEDKNCKMLKNSREMWNMGMRGAAIKLLCQDEDNRFALESTGVDCGETKQAWQDNGSKVAVVKHPVPSAVAQAPTPQAVVADAKAQVIESKAVAIIEADQKRKMQQVAAQ